MADNDDSVVSGASTRNDSSRSALISDGLDRLDDQYQAMADRQAILLQALEKLQQEEACLSKALALAQEPSKPPQKPKKKDEAAIQRLQEALLAEDDDSDDESSVMRS